MIDKILFDKKRCTGCCSCFNICPVDAISMKMDREGFYYPNINETICKKCGLCLKVCPVIKKEINNQFNIVSYACFHKNETICYSSSSGGVFSALSEFVLKNNGIVFGAAFDDEWDVKHIYIDNIKDIYKLKTSKYVQSYIELEYKKVKQFLDEGLIVLFSGTPCQVAGLKKYLVRNYDNLYTVDFVCHGVPSPLVWRKYLRRIIEKEYIKIHNIKNINFRDKSISWKEFCLSIVTDSKKIYANKKRDLYLLGFLKDLYLRPSCYECMFKTVSRTSDITIADFWEIDRIFPKFDSKYGVSQIFIQSSKGKYLFDNIKENLYVEPIDINLSVKHNTNMIVSAKKHKNREKFFEDFIAEKNSVDFLIEKYYIDGPFRKRVVNIIKCNIKMIIQKIKLILGIRRRLF